MRATRGVAIGAVVFLSLISVTVILAGCSTAVPGVGVTVPVVTDKTLTQAEGVLTAAGLTVGEVTYDETVAGSAAAPSSRPMPNKYWAPGTVMSQYPVAGGRADRGVSVALVIAGGPPTLVPDVSGLRRAKAQAVLRDAGLWEGIRGDGFSDSVMAGEIMSQTPAPQAYAPRGSFVDIVVSRGPGRERVHAPNLVGMPYEDAQETLLLMDLLPRRQTGTQERSPESGGGVDEVVRQSPPAGTELARSSIVRIWVRSSD